MSSVFDIIAVVIGSVFFIKALLLIKSGRVNPYSIFVVLFYVFQFVPVIVDFFNRESFDELSAINIKRALNDHNVAIVYDFVISIVISWLYYKSKEKDSTFNYYFNKIRGGGKGSFISYLALIVIFLPAVAVFISPNPSVYLIWAYSYIGDMSIIEEDYHSTVVIPCLQLSMFAVIAYYYLKRGKSIIVYLAIAMITWISFKRTNLAFLCIMVLLIDYMIGKYKNRFSLFIRKSIIMLVICGTYFVAYSNYTGKNTGSEYGSYTMYFSRHYSVKTALYDQMNGNKMLNYRGQTILFDLFFYVPRTLWKDKPAMYSKYFTSYAKGNVGDYHVSTNYYVNIWSEFISNFHLFGVFLALAFIQIFIRYIGKTRNSIVYFGGLTFISFYFFWGIQPFTLLLIGIIFFAFIYGKIKFGG